MAKTQLTNMQEAFCVAYIDLGDSGTQAAISAGSSPNSAHVAASKWLKMPKVRKRIKELRDALADKVLCTKEELIRDWLKVKDGDPSEVMEWDEAGIAMIPSKKLTKEQRKLVKSISHTITGTGGSFKVEVEDRATARKELAKLLGYYPAEKSEVEHKGNVTFEVVDYSKSVRAKSGASGS